MIHPLRIFLTFLLIAPSIAISQESKRPLSIDDVLNLKTVRSPQISPDGQWIAYTVSEMDLKKDKSETRIWMIPAKGGEARAMTGKGYSASQPRWSPDNKYLSFVASKGEGKSQVWTLHRQGGEAEQLTNIMQGVSGHEWSPDGKKLLLSIRDPKPEELTKDKEDDKKPKPFIVDRLQFKRDYAGYLNRYRTHLYVYTPGDSTAIQITSGDYDDSSPVWKPDGTAIAFVSNRSENPDGNANSDIWIVSANNTDKGQTLLQVTQNTNADRSPTWSPDGRSIAYTTITDGDAIWYATQKLAIISATGGEPKLLADELDRNISAPKFSDDGKSIYFILEESGTSIIASINPSGKGLNRVIKGDISVRSFVMKESLIAPLMGKSLQPHEIFTFQNGQLKKLTGANDDIVARIQKPTVEKINFSSADGTAIEGFVVKPVGFDPTMKYPAILWNHGGPVSQYEFSFHSIAQLYAANGYVTLLINPRGSSGYGQPFSEALFADWGNKDFQDVMAGVDHVIAAGYVDENRLGVGGWSYGGILTNYVITQTERFKGAISGASEALYRTNYGHDHYQLYWELELGLPWENAEAWERISPFNKVANITTPTLWMGGGSDWNVPIINSEQMYQAMKRLGRETQLVVYPGEHHGFRRPTFIKDRYERFLAWYDKYVK
ncbi:MAG: S9 family peptidase [Cyclobacteriaceae bacterium]